MREARLLSEPASLKNPATRQGQALPLISAQAPAAPMMIRNPWFGFGMNAGSLGIDASSVIALRILRITAGGVVTEKDRDRLDSAGAGADRWAWPYGFKRRDQDPEALTTQSACEQTPAGRATSGPRAWNCSASAPLPYGMPRTLWHSLAQQPAPG
jgi:hypothetical protein